jgi:hypothetical protein
MSGLRKADLFSKESLMSEERKQCCGSGVELMKRNLRPVPVNTPLFLWFTMNLVWYCIDPVFLGLTPLDINQIDQMDFPNRFLVGVAVVWFMIFCISSAVWTLFSGWFLGLWVKEVLIGRTIYKFKNVFGRIHVHTNLPEYWEQHDGQLTKLVDGHRYVVAFDDSMPSDTHCAVGSILKLREGGFFRKCEVLGYPWSSWQIKSCWNAQDIVLEDSRKMVIGGQGMDDDTLFHLLMYHTNIGTTIGNYRALSRDVALVVDKVRRERKTMGDSHHVRAITRFLKHSLSDFVPTTLCEYLDGWIETNPATANEIWDGFSQNPRGPGAEDKPRASAG